MRQLERLMLEQEDAGVQSTRALSSTDSNSIAGLAYILQGIRKYESMMTRDEMLTQLNRWTGLSLVQCGLLLDGGSCKMQRSLPSCAKLETIDWKIGVAKASDTCRHLGVPFVHLQLQMSTKEVFDMELTYDQFQVGDNTHIGYLIYSFKNRSFKVSLNQRYKSCNMYQSILHISFHANLKLKLKFRPADVVGGGGRIIIISTWS